MFRVVLVNMIWQQQGWVFCVPGTKPSMTSACGQSSDSIGDPDWVHLLSHRSFILFWGSWRLVWVGLVLIHLVQKVLCFFCFKQLYRPSGFTIHIITFTFRLDESTPKHAWLTDTVYAYLLKSMHVCQEKWLAFSWHFCLLALRHMIQNSENFKRRHEKRQM